MGRLSVGMFPILALSTYDNEICLFRPLDNVLAQYKSCHFCG